MTKDREEIDRILNTQSFDTALPREWVHSMQQLGEDPRNHFVWAYDAGSAFGRPAPIDERGDQMLRRFNEVKGSRFPLTFSSDFDN